MLTMNQVKRELRNLGCNKESEGSKHEHWINPKTGQRFRLSRHNHEISQKLLRDIEKQAGVKLFRK